MSKICSKCRKTQPLILFSKNNSTKDRLNYFCKECEKAERIIRTEYMKQYYINNKEVIREYKKRYRLKHRDRIIQKGREYIIQTKERRKAKYHLNKDKHVQYEKMRRDTDITYKLARNLRIRISHLIRKTRKSGSTIKDLGCTLDFFKQYLESKFYTRNNGDIMSWSNYGLYGWHIDHIIPLSAFDLTDRQQFLKACHYTNLQPLWAEDNLSKSDKIIFDKVLRIIV